MVFITWRLASCAKPELILWLWKKIRKSWCACLHIVMFCHGWQNKAASSHGWLVVAVHVTPRKSNSGIPRLFLFSDNGTKITPALRKMPLTSLRYTIWGDDLFHKQTSIWRTVYSYITYVTAADWGHHLRSLYKINAKQRRQILCSCKGSRILLRKTRRILCTKH